MSKPRKTHPTHPVPNPAPEPPKTPIEPQPDEETATTKKPNGPPDTDPPSSGGGELMPRLALSSSVALNESRLIKKLLEWIGLDPGVTGDVTIHTPSSGIITMNVNIWVTQENWKAAIRAEMERLEEEGG